MKTGSLSILLALLLAHPSSADDTSYVVSSRKGSHFFATGSKEGKCYKVKGNADFQLQWKCTEQWPFWPTEVFLSESGDCLIVLPHVSALRGEEAGETAMMIFSKGTKTKSYNVGTLVDPKNDIDRLRGEPVFAYIFSKARFANLSVIAESLTDDELGHKATTKEWSADKEFFWITTNRGKHILVDPVAGEIAYMK